MERDEQLRSDLASLRLDRDDPLPMRGAPRRGKRWLWVSVGVVITAVAAMLFVARQARVVTLVRVTVADAATAASTPVLSGAGYLVPGDKIAEIGARVPGRVAAYLVEEGQSVEAGQPLVRLDDREYRSHLDETRARLARATAEAGLARAELRRGRELLARDFLSQGELDVRVAKSRTTDALVLEAEAAMRRAELDLEDTLLRSPTRGIVLKKLKEAGEIAVPGGFSGSGDLVRIANLDDLRAEVDVNESDLARVRLGQRAEVTPDAIADARFAASVVKLDPQVDRQKGTLKVQVRLIERDARLLPDMSARISFLGEPAADGAATTAVLAPSSSVRRGTDGRAYVWVSDRGTAHRVFVETAGIVGDRVRITKGLEGDEEVVVGEEPTREGQRIRPATPSAGG